LLGLIAPSAGSASLLGRPVRYGSSDHLIGVGATVETPGFYRHLTGRENLRCLIRMSKDRWAPTRGDEALSRVGLAEHADEVFRTYSQGMKQRLALAAALLSGTDLLILDEPTTGLDPGGVREITDVLVDLRSRGTTILLSTHMLAEAGNWCDYGVVIDHGQVVASGAINELPGVETAVFLATDATEATIQVLASIGVPATPEPDGRLRLPGDADIPRVVAALAAASVSIVSIGRSEPSLADVYRAATGGRAGD